jgi:hypothetical protein
MVAHKGPARLRPRCTRSGSSVTAIPVKWDRTESNCRRSQGSLWTVMSVQEDEGGKFTAADKHFQVQMSVLGDPDVKWDNFLM